MSSGCAPIAKTTLPDIILIPAVSAHSDGFPRRGRFVSSKNHFMAFGGIGKARQRHFLPLVQRVKKCLELGLVWMVGNIARIEHLHGYATPSVFVRLHL